MATRFFTFRVLVESTLPPLIRLSGQSPSQEAKAEALRNRLTSGPTAVSTVLRAQRFTDAEVLGLEHCGYGDLEWAAGVCGRCGQSMGIESTFACNGLKL
jgi:hypothetical protein